MSAAREEFQYVLLRVVPHVERGESLNAGVVLFCRRMGFLGCRVGLDAGRLAALAPDAAPEPIRDQLAALARVAAGDAEAGPIAALEPAERFGWLTAPSSTVIQPSPVHTGLCDDPQSTLERLFAELVDARAIDRLAAMRRAYESTGLDEADVAATWLDQFERWLRDAVSSGAVEPNAMVLATADADGRPSARTVLLKGVDDRGFTLFTNLGSRKGRDAEANPRGSIVLPWIALHRQVLASGALERVADAEADAYFATRPRGSALSAAASPQSRVILSRDVLLHAREEIERRYPPGTPVPRPEGWGGLRLVPDEVEFWQGRPDRLHDRLRFRRDPVAGWLVERLAP